MIISRTPFRVSFFGGGTDYPAWYQEHGGAVLSCSINRYCYVAARFRPPFFPEKHRVVWSQIELADHANTLRHPSVRAVLPYLGITDGVEIQHFADLPARTGLGSSSAFTVGLLNALLNLQGHEPGAAQLADQAIHVEQTLLAETVGIQDQIQTAHGGFNYVQIARDGTYSLKPILMTGPRWNALHSYMLLFFTGIARTASGVAAAQVQNIAAGARDRELRNMSAMAARAAEILTNGGELTEFGLMLHSAWMLKRGLSEAISTPQIDAMYEAAIKAGAMGGKLLGAGGGGFMLIFSRPEFQPAVRGALAEYLEVPFRVEFHGSRVIYKN